MNGPTTYSTWVLCFLAGGFAGAAAGLLLAPQSGKTTRDSMRRKLHETDSSARGFKDRILRRGEEIRDEATRRVSAAASALAGNGADEVAPL